MNRVIYNFGEVGNERNECGYIIFCRVLIRDILEIMGWG